MGSRDWAKTPSKMRLFAFLLIAAASAAARPYDPDEWGNCMAMCTPDDTKCTSHCDTYLNAVGESGSGSGWDDGMDYSGSGGDYYPGWDDGLDYSGSGSGWDYSGSGTGWGYSGTGSGWDYSGSGSDYSGSGTGWGHSGTGSGWGYSGTGMDYSGSGTGWGYSGTSSGSGYDYV